MNPTRSITTLARRQFPHLAAALAVAACATTFVASAAHTQEHYYEYLARQEYLKHEQMEKARRRAQLREQERVKKSPRSTLEDLFTNVEPQRALYFPAPGSRETVRITICCEFGTTDGTTDPQPGWWVPWGSVRGAALKKRNVNADVTLAEGREAVGGNGNGGDARSDVRLKRDIVLLAHLDNGLGLYRYRYLWSHQRYVGVMAQEVATVMPAAVRTGPDGYLRVDYGRLGLRLQTWDEWRAAH